MTWEDRELLAELARLNGEMAQLGMRIMERSATAGEQEDYAERLIVAGKRLERRAQQQDRGLRAVVEGDVVADAEVRARTGASDQER
ncbi:MAG: hypothetical protein ACRDT0_14420 [Pseudonocardiaceae bacterium]